MKPLLFILAALAVSASPLGGLVPELQAAAAQEPQAFSLRWERTDKVEKVRGIYPHLTDPRIAWAATAEGLWRTDDEARTWRALPASCRRAPV